MNVPTDDLDRLMEVMDTAFDPVYGEAWTRRQVEDALLVGNCNYGLVNAEGSIPNENEPAVGFYLSRSAAQEEELLLFAVIPEYRRRGLGRTLLQMLRSDALSRGIERIFLEMRKGNPAESLYSAFGFSPIGVRPDYYKFTNGNRIDAITFGLNI